jgi:hypothetical protein
LVGEVVAVGDELDVGDSDGENQFGDKVGMEVG